MKDGNTQTDLWDFDDHAHSITDRPFFKTKIQRKFTAIDLFAGAGGFSLGLSSAGFNVIGAVEIDSSCCDTLRCNRRRAFPNMRIIQEDITKLTGERLMKLTGIKERELYMLVGGPPCQGFSTSNMNRSIDNPKSKLMFEFIRMTKELQPRIFYVENVPGLFAYKDFFRLLMQHFEDCGYCVRFQKLDMVNYGVPQHRVRIFIQGTRSDIRKLPVFPTPTNFSKEALKRTGFGPTPAEIGVRCFQVNGFSKEEIKEVWFNSKLEIMMVRKTAPKLIDAAVHECIVEALLAHAKKRKKKKKSRIPEPITKDELRPLL